MRFDMTLPFPGQRALLAQRWQAMPSRDRLAITLLALFMLLVVLYLGLWLPAERRVEQAKTYFEQQRALNLYLQSRAPEVRGLQDRPAQASVDPARLQGVVTSTAAEQGLAVERLDNEGEAGVQVSLQPAPFPQLLRWFLQLQEQGVSIQEAGLDRAEEGRVAARLSLKAGS
ncbi:type II secretion system protein M [Pseudomonas sp. RIT-PI-AD]|uniref:type II secretion system protein M n=1 Tax=Pseudomonas sp. RIT-PI-AD TaxID=3035294 RepID=UPI0021D9A129|nr:type II secretion system protein M [Pseudomonas sp. RIT-PI-AD]